MPPLCLSSIAFLFIGQVKSRGQPFDAEKVVRRILRRQSGQKRAVPASQIHFKWGAPAENHPHVLGIGFELQQGIEVVAREREQQEKQRREMVQRMWQKLAGGDPLDMVA